MKTFYVRLIMAGGLIALGAGGRILLLDFPNVETVTVASLLAGALLGGVYVFIVPLTIIALTDMYLGNEAILLFTWSAWAVIGGLGWLLRRSKKNYLFGFKITGLGMIASLFFYLWTNFGVWLLWPRLYPPTLFGLEQCYLMGLPFLKMSLIGNLIIIPLIVFPGIFLSQYWQKNFSRLTLLKPKLTKMLFNERQGQQKNYRS